MFSPSTVVCGAAMFCPSVFGAKDAVVAGAVEALEANAAAIPAKVVRNFFMVNSLYGSCYLKIRGIAR